MCDVLASVYNVILGFSCVPEVIKMGTVIPVLKKPTLNASMPENYRPITTDNSLSSTHAKMVEMLLIPDSAISNTQFGFRATRRTSFGCALLNDVRPVAMIFVWGVVLSQKLNLFFHFCLGSRE